MNNWLQIFRIYCPEGITDISFIYQRLITLKLIRILFIYREPSWTVSFSPWEWYNLHKNRKLLHFNYSWTSMIARRCKQSVKTRIADVLDAVRTKNEKITWEIYWQSTSKIINIAAKSYYNPYNEDTDFFFFFFCIINEHREAGCFYIYIYITMPMIVLFVLKTKDSYVLWNKIDIILQIYFNPKESYGFLADLFIANSF